MVFRKCVEKRKRKMGFEAMKKDGKKYQKEKKPKVHLCGDGKHEHDEKK
jgi:hypothetical protein